MTSKDNEFLEETEVYQIPLHNGSVMEIQATSEFFKKIRKQFNISDFQPVTDDHIKQFIWKNCDDAFDRFERNNSK